jgi:hypothetical protein
VIDAREFQLEKQMTPFVDRWLSASGFCVKHEMVFGWGVCDLVGVRFSPRQVQKRLKFGQHESVGSFRRLLVLMAVPDIRSHRSTCPSRIVDRFAGSLTNEEVCEHLEGLVRARFVVQTAVGNFQKLNGWMPLEKRLVAVELKLDRVSEALDQAIANQRVAADSFVAMPLQTALNMTRGRRSDEFVRRGIGLVGVSRRGCDVLISTRPKQVSGVDIAVRTHCVERFWRTFRATATTSK